MNNLDLLRDCLNGVKKLFLFIKSYRETADVEVQRIFNTLGCEINKAMIKLQERQLQLEKTCEGIENNQRQQDLQTSSTTFDETKSRLERRLGQVEGILGALVGEDLVSKSNAELFEMRSFISSQKDSKQTDAPYCFGETEKEKQPNKVPPTWPKQTLALDETGIKAKERKSLNPSRQEDSELQTHAPSCSDREEDTTWLIQGTLGQVVSYQTGVLFGWVGVAGGALNTKYLN